MIPYFRNEYKPIPKILSCVQRRRISFSLTLRLVHFLLLQLIFFLEDFFPRQVLNNFTYSSQYQLLIRQKPLSLGF
jgi:hypothetical protein